MIETFPTDLRLDARLKRARMRAWRRGMREMDLILGGFIDRNGESLDADALSVFEGLLARRDQDLYRWVCRGGDDAPDDASPPEADLMRRIVTELPFSEPSLRAGAAD